MFFFPASSVNFTFLNDVSYFISRSFQNRYIDNDGVNDSPVCRSIKVTPYLQSVRRFGNRKTVTTRDDSTLEPLIDEDSVSSFNKLRW